MRRWMLEAGSHEAGVRINSDPFFSRRRFSSLGLLEQQCKAVCVAAD